MAICKHCKKDFKRNGLAFHEPYCKANPERVNHPMMKSENSYEKNDRQNQEREHYDDSYEKKDEIANKKFNEVDMSTNYTEKKAEIEPQKSTEEYQCGACGATFTKRHRFCPSCGVGFE